MKVIILWLKRLLILFLSLVVFYGVARVVVVYADSIIEGERAPYLQMPTSDGMTIRWQTDESEIGVVRYGPAPDSLDMSVAEETPKEIHELRVTGLKPNTRYYYSVGNTEQMSYGGDADYWFMTSPENGKPSPVRLWVLGDSGQANDIVVSTRDAMKKWMIDNKRSDRPLFDQWLMLGDNAYSSGTNEQYQKALFDVFPEELRTTALWSTYGNHDSRRWTYFRIFTFPENAEIGGVASGTENYYSFDYANIHYVILDSQDSDLDEDGEMAEWLRDDLSQNQQTWTLVFSHHPPYSKGTHDSDSERDSRGRLVNLRENILPILEAYGVDLMMSGHSHVYERSRMISCHFGDSTQFETRNVVSDGVKGMNQHYLKPLAAGPNQGTIYMVAGASSRTGHGEFDHPVMVVSSLENGSVVIDVEGERLVSRYVNGDGVIVDQFTITKKSSVSETGETSKRKNKNNCE